MRFSERFSKNILIHQGLCQSKWKVSAIKTKTTPAKNVNDKTVFENPWTILAVVEAEIFRWNKKSQLNELMRKESCQPT